MNKIKPYWSFVIEALSIDYDNTHQTWEELFKDIFIDKTNIYSLMYRLLVYIGINPKDNINKEEVSKNIYNLITTYEIIDTDGLLEIKIIYDSSVHPLASMEEVSKTLEAIGYKEMD